LVFNVKRSTYYAAMRTKTDKYESEKELIKQIFHYHKGRYGYRRITEVLHRAGFPLNHKTVKRLMNELGLKSFVRPKKYHSYKGIEGKSFPNILKRNFKVTGFNQKWVTDVTEFNICGQRIFLSALIELYNQEVISYTISNSPSLKFVCMTIRNIFDKYENLSGLIIHSDQGWHYKTESYTQMLSMKGVIQSMSRKGNCLDNCMVENFFGLLKTEFYYMNKFSSVEDFKKALIKYIEYYNTERIKMGLNGLSPIEFRAQNAA
jgi:transposase InsO family protein